MGSGVSTLPERVSAAEARVVLGEFFDQAVFDSLLDGDDGHITRAHMLDAIETSLDHKLHESFLRFCPHDEIDSKTFAKMCKDTHLIGKTFANTDADLLFSKGKAKNGASKALPYSIFRSVLVVGVAEKLHKTEHEIMAIIAHSSGPHLNATQADNVRFHDDQSTFTGTHAQGGPDVTEHGGVGAGGLEYHLDRSSADVRGVKVAAAGGGHKSERHAQAAASTNHEEHAPKHKSERRASREEPAVAAVPAPAPAAAHPPAHHTSGHGHAAAHASGHAHAPAPAAEGGHSGSGDIHAVFMQYCPTGEMDSRTFVKLVKDTHVIGKKFSSNDADLVFSKAKGKGGAKISFETFMHVAVPGVAEKRGESVDVTLAKLTNTSGPSLTGATQAEAVRFHDDQSTFTGSHAHGGPDFTEHGGVGVTLQDQLDRSDADVRGVKTQSS